MAYELSDELLCALTKEWAAALPERYPAAERPRRYSFRFRRKMRPILRRAEKEEAASAPVRPERFAVAMADAGPGRRLGKMLRPGRLAAALVAAALLTATVAMAFPAIREKIFRRVRQTDGEYTRIYYERVAGDGTYGVFVRWHPAAIPEGYTLEEERVTEVSYAEDYRGPEGLPLFWYQVRMEEADLAPGIEAAGEEVALTDGLGQWPARYITNGPMGTVYWNDGEYWFFLTGYLSGEELAEIAGSYVPFHDGTEDDEPRKEFIFYRFSGLPEGFELERYRAFDGSHGETFVNEEGLYIGLEQDRLDGAFAFSYSGTREPEELLLDNGLTAWYVDRPGLQLVYWDDGEYSFQVVTTLSGEEAIDLANSVVPVEEPFAGVSFTPYRAAYLPEGFSPMGSLAKKDCYQLRCENGEGSWLTLDQVWYDWSAFADDFGEDRPADLFILGSQQVDILERPEGRAVYWDWGGYSFRLASDVLSADELIKVVINLHPAGKAVEVFSPYRLTYAPEGYAHPGDGYSRGQRYEDYEERIKEDVSDGEWEDSPGGISFFQERLGEADRAIDAQGLEPAAFTLEDGRTVWVVADPPEERTLWTQYAYAVWWEDGEYLLSLWSTLPWEETVKVIQGIQQM